MRETLSPKQGGPHSQLPEILGLGIDLDTDLCDRDRVPKLTAIHSRYLLYVGRACTAFRYYCHGLSHFFMDQESAGLIVGQTDEPRSETEVRRFPLEDPFRGSFAKSQR